MPRHRFNRQYRRELVEMRRQKSAELGAAATWQEALYGRDWCVVRAGHWWYALQMGRAGFWRDRYCGPSLSFAIREARIIARGEFLRQSAAGRDVRVRIAE